MLIMNQPLLDYFKKYLNTTPGSHTPGVKSANTPGVELTPSSIKNYLSDVNLFLNWVSRTIQEDTVHAKHITPAIIQAYQKYLTQKINPATARRHFSSLRRFGQFLTATNRLDQNPTQALIDTPSLPTMDQVLKQYTEYLKAENLSASTIKNYLSDLNNYLIWQQQQGSTLKDIGAQKGRTLIETGVKYRNSTDNNSNIRPSN